MLGKFSVKKPYTVLVAVILVVVLGVVSFTKMSADLLPSISLPYVIVMTTYPGASPETVEMVVTKPVEASMATVSNIEEISSVSSENYSMVILEFAQSTDIPLSDASFPGFQALGCCGLLPGYHLIISALSQCLS